MGIAVIGAGYVGLVVAACFADAGVSVCLVERDPERVELLRSGGCPIFEPGLPDLLRSGQDQGLLRFTTEVGPALRGADACFLAVGTPPLADGAPDLSALHTAVDAVASALTGPAVLVLKSTVPVGTHADVEARLARRCAHPVAVVSNPEFLREGHAVTDFQRASRVVLGGRDPDALALVRRLYRPFLSQPDRLMVMDPQSAELTKYAANAMLAARVSFMNELSRLCEVVDGDIAAVQRGLQADPRIGAEYLSPSIGYGGSCLPKDVEALARLGREHGVPLRLVEATAQANSTQLDHWTARVVQAAAPVQGAVLAVWGLTFKAHTDDTRASAAVALVRRLHELGARLRLHDPQARRTPDLTGPRFAWCDDPYEAATGADALLICTEWPIYRAPDLGRLARCLRRPLLLDGRNLLEPDQLHDTPFTYHSIGRPTVYGRA